MRLPSYFDSLPRGLLIALAPFLLLHIGLGIADVLRLDKADPGFGMTGDGRITEIQPGGPAEAAGIQTNDRIIAIGGVPMHDYDALIQQSADQKVGKAVRYRIARGQEEMEVTLLLARLDRAKRMKLASLAAIGIAFLAVGLMVVARRGDTMAIVFYSLTAVFAFLFSPVPDRPLLAWHFLIKVLYSFCFLFLPALFVHFFLIFPFRRKIIRRHPKLIPSLYLAALLLFGVAVTLDSFFLLDHRFELLPVISFFTAFTGVLIVPGLAIGIGAFITSYLRSPAGHLRRRLKIVLWGTVLGILPLIIASFATLFFPSAALPGIQYYHLSLFMVPLAFAYAIVRYGLMDLEIILKRSVVYTVLTAMLAAIYLLVVEGIGSLAMGPDGDRSVVLKLISILVMAIVFSPVRSWVQDMVDRTFYRDRLNYRETLREVSEQLSGFIELEPLVDLFARRVSESLRVSGVAIYLRDKKTNEFALAHAIGAAEGGAACYTWSLTDQVFVWARERHDVLPIERLQESVRWHRLPRGEKQALRDLKAAVVLPIRASEDCLGLLIVGNKISGDIHTNEDIALLRTVTAQASVAIDNALLHRESIAKARLEEELTVARQIQESFLPNSLPRMPGIEVSALNVPCLEVGGDYYDLLVLENDKRLGIAIGDASGKGVPAALVMASLQAAFHAEAEVNSSPARVLSRMNRMVMRQTGSERFVTFFYGILDLETRVLTYANAGHNPPLLVCRDGKATALDEAGLLLGVNDDTVYHDVERPLGEGDLLFLYTDGVTDELNRRDDLFGVERLEAALTQTVQLPLGDLLKSVYQSVADFMGGTPEDDITLLGLKLH